MGGERREARTRQAALGLSDTFGSSLRTICLTLTGELWTGTSTTDTSGVRSACLPCHSSQAWPPSSQPSGLPSSRWQFSVSSRGGGEGRPWPAIWPPGTSSTTAQHPSNNHSPTHDLGSWSWPARTAAEVWSCSTPTTIIMNTKTAVMIKDWLLCIMSNRIWWNPLSEDKLERAFSEPNWECLAEPWQSKDDLINISCLPTFSFLLPPICPNTLKLWSKWCLETGAV